jgi:hypothetical protein
MRRLQSGRICFKRQQQMWTKRTKFSPRKWRKSKNCKHCSRKKNEQRKKENITCFVYLKVCERFEPRSPLKDGEPTRHTRHQSRKRLFETKSDKSGEKNKQSNCYSSPVVVCTSDVKGSHFGIVLNLSNQLAEHTRIVCLVFVRKKKKTTKNKNRC